MEDKELVVKISCGRDDLDETMILNALQAWSAGTWVVQHIDWPEDVERYEGLLPSETGDLKWAK